LGGELPASPPPPSPGTRDKAGARAGVKEGSGALGGAEVRGGDRLDGGGVPVHRRHIPHGATGPQRMTTKVRPFILRSPRRGFPLGRGVLLGPPPTPPPQPLPNRTLVNSPHPKKSSMVRKGGVSKAAEKSLARSQIAIFLPPQKPPSPCGPLGLRRNRDRGIADGRDGGRRKAVWRGGGARLFGSPHRAIGTRNRVSPCALD